MEKNKKDAKEALSRRNFLRGAGIASAGVASAIALSGCSPSEATSSSAGSSTAVGLETKYDVDILIVGAGLSGFCAGVRALELGIDPSRLLMIDKLSGENGDFAGSSTYAMGNYLLPTDNSDAAKEYYAQTVYEKSGKKTNLDLLTVLGDQAMDALDWLIEKGCEYTEAKDYEDGLMQRTMVKPGNVYTLRDVYEAEGGKTLYNVKAHKLNVNAGGVCGVMASDAEGYYNIAAKKVLMCAGGYLSNPAMRERFIGDAGANVEPRSPFGVTGDGITMIEEVGGSLARNCHGVESLYLSCSSVESLTSGHAYRALKYSIAVNAEGKRFCDEGVLDNVAQAHLRKLYHEPGCVMGMVSDIKRFDEMNNYEGLGRLEEVGVPIYTFDTLEEVADLFKVPHETLKATVDEFNAHVTGDHTEGLAIDKSAMAMTVDTAPYYAFYPFVLTSSLTFVGILADTNARVTQADGAIIPNLYASGELVGGFFYDLYFGGSQQTKAVVFGRIAAESAMDDLAK